MAWLKSNENAWVTAALVALLAGIANFLHTWMQGSTSLSYSKMLASGFIAVVVGTTAYGVAAAYWPEVAIPIASLGGWVGGRGVEAAIATAQRAANKKIGGGSK